MRTASTWKTVLAVFLLFSFAGADISSAQTKTQERIKELEEQIKVLADEVEKLKSAAVTEPPTYEMKFGAAPAASKVYLADRGVSFGGYGELLISQVKEGDGNNVVDTQRVILYNGYKYNDNIVFNSEIEFEHATTGANQDGKSGSASVEFALLDFLIRDEFNLRGGLLLAPVGLTNEIHEPTTFYGVIRPSVERQIIPTTWREAGVGAHGEFDMGGGGTLAYKVYGMSSLDSRGFKASNNRSLRVKGNRARFEDMALVSRLQYDPFPGIRVGGSLFYGNTGQDVTVAAKDGDGNAVSGHALNGRKIGGRFSMYEVDAQVQYAGFDLRALSVWTRLKDAELINANLGFEGDESVGSKQSGWYVTGAYNLLSAFDSGSRYLEYLAPFVRYERYDTQKAVPAGFARDAKNRRNEYTFGLNYKPISNVVVKAEYQRLDNAAEEAKGQFNFGLGYVF